MSAEEVKQRYQLFQRVREISFDNIKEDIRSISTPCSDAFELTYDELKHLTEAMCSDWKFDSVEIRCLSKWYTTDEIMAKIESEKKRAEAELQRIALFREQSAKRAKAKAEKKASFKAQCEGKNGKVK